MMDTKKQKEQKRVCHKRKIKLPYYKNCLEAAQIETKTNHLENNKTDVNNFKEDQIEFIKNNKVLLNTQQRFKIERHNIFTEEVNKIALSSYDDKRMQSIY